MREYLTEKWKKFTLYYVYVLAEETDIIMRFMKITIFK